MRESRVIYSRRIGILITMCPLGVEEDYSYNLCIEGCRLTFASDQLYNAIATRKSFLSRNFSSSQAPLCSDICGQGAAKMHSLEKARWDEKHGLIPVKLVKGAGFTQDEYIDIFLLL